MSAYKLIVKLDIFTEFSYLKTNGFFSIQFFFIKNQMKSKSVGSLLRRNLPRTVDPRERCSNTLIDTQQSRFSCQRGNEAISTSSFFFSSSFDALAFFALLRHVSSRLCTRQHNTSYGCANAKYVGRSFLLAQRFSNSLPAFVSAANERRPSQRQKRLIRRNRYHE